MRGHLRQRGMPGSCAFTRARIPSRAAGCCAMQLQGKRRRLVNTPWARTPPVQRHGWGAGPGGELSVPQRRWELFSEERRGSSESQRDDSLGSSAAAAAGAW